MRPTISLLLSALCVSAVAGEPPQQDPKPPVIQPKPVTPVQPQPVPVNPMLISDWRTYLEDFQSADAAKQQAATKVFIDSGLRGHGVLAGLLKNPNADVVKRANEVRQQIDARSWQEYQNVNALKEKVMKEPLTVAALNNLRDAWQKMAMYASQNALRQVGFQTITELQKTIKSVDDAGKILTQLDQALKANPEPQGLARASLQIDRANALKTLQRDAEALAAAENAAQASGKDGRHTPAALKLQIEIASRMDDGKKVEALCQNLIQEHPGSLEVKFAHHTLVQVLSTGKLYDQAAAEAKAFLALFPIDEESQEAAYTLLGTLMEDEQDYKRVTPLAQWLFDTLPIDRLKPDVPKLLGGCNEYITRDYAKAEKAYAFLRDKFADVVAAEDMNKAIERLKVKAEGKFPKEPAESDPAPAGTLAQFLKAVRTRDAKAIAKLVPKDEVEDYVEILTDGGDEKVPTLAFADFIVKNVELNDKKDEAKITIDWYEASENKPRTITQEAIIEDGQWKIVWEDLDLMTDDPTPASQPGAVQPLQPKSAGPQPAPAQPAHQPAPTQPAPKP